MEVSCNKRFCIVKGIVNLKLIFDPFTTHHYVDGDNPHNHSGASCRERIQQYNSIKANSGHVLKHKKHNMPLYCSCGVIQKTQQFKFVFSQNIHCNLLARNCVHVSSQIYMLLQLALLEMN